MASNAGGDFYSHQRSIKYDTLTPLSTYDVHIPDNQDPSTSSQLYWIIYIHGGAWRDPAQTSRSIEPSLPHLSPSAHRIAGIVSINYRLSPYPDHPTYPSSPNDKSRNAVHPDHIEDALTAIRFLQHKYAFGERYILVGHSCGATLAFQAVMGLWSPRKLQTPYDCTSLDQDSLDPASDLKLPLALVGVEGIYDVPHLLATHTHPAYRTFLESAFGTDQRKWKEPSPVSAKLREGWPRGKVVVLAQSKDDELVDWAQTERMSDALWREKMAGRRDVVIKLSGGHDEVWEKGEQLAKAIEKALEMLKVSEEKGI